MDSFINEVRISAKLEHPNIIPLYDIGVENKQVFFTMKKLSGHNLYDLIKSKDNSKQLVPLNERLEIFLKVCDAISFSHSKNILHLDIKPANIQVDDFGEVLVCDWGLARDLSDNDTISEDLSTQDLHPKELNLSYNNKIKGTPGYMAPEQISRRFGSRSQKTDVFSLGGLLYFLLTDKKPFSGSNIEQILKQTEMNKLIEPIKRSPEKTIPKALNSVVIRAMKTESSQRYASVKELSDDIRAYLQGFATAAEEAGFSKELKLLIIRNKTPFILSFIGLFASLLITVFFIHKLNKEKLNAQAAQAHAEAMANKALTSEEMALRAQKEAETSQSKALILVNELQVEKQYSSELKIKAADELMKKAFFTFRKNRNYFSATNTVNMVLELKPNHQDALYHSALMEMGAFKMHKVSKKLADYQGSKDTAWIRKGSKKFLTPKNFLVKYTWQDQLNFVNELLDSPYNADKQYVAWHINSSIHHEFSMEDCIKYARSSLKRRNKSKQFNYAVKKLPDGTYRVSIPHSRCAPYEEIRHWKISELNLSYSDFHDLTILWSYPLKTLDISHTQVNTLDKAWELPLEELNIKGTTIGDYEVIYQWPLKKLTINEFCYDLFRINEIKTLEELILPRGVYKAITINNLNKNIKISYYDHGR